VESREAERRRAERFRVIVPVRLEEGSGITRDISTEGVFFETSERSLSVGASVRLALLFGRVQARKPPLEVECEGQVRRVEEIGEQVGVAVAFTSYAFE
jgi:hypothetical protein